MGKRLSIECTKGAYWGGAGRSIEIDWNIAASVDMIGIDLIEGGVHEDMVLKLTKLLTRWLSVSDCICERDWLECSEG